MSRVTMRRRRKAPSGPPLNPQLWLSDTYTDTAGKLLTAHIPEVGPKVLSWATTASSPAGGLSVAYITGSRLEVTTDVYGKTTIGETDTKTLPDHQTFDLSVQRSACHVLDGQAKTFIDDVEIRFTYNAANKITCTVAGTPVDVVVSPNWVTNTLYNFRVTYDGETYRFYFRDGLIHSATMPRLLNRFKMSQRSYSTGDQIGLIDNLKIYVDMVNPAFGSY